MSVAALLAFVISKQTSANKAWGKVMFLHLCVILLTGEGSATGVGRLHPAGGGAGGICIGESASIRVYLHPGGLGVCLQGGLRPGVG